MLACKKPHPVNPVGDPVVSQGDYDLFSEEVTDVPMKPLDRLSPIGPTYFPIRRYGYRESRFNPNDPYEILYLREDYQGQGDCHFELWTFNFRDGTSRKITDQVCYSPEWNTNDWISFTAQDRHIWKIRSSGDSLTQLTEEDGFQNHAKWNPSSTLFSYRGVSFEHVYIHDAMGERIMEVSQGFEPLGWVNDSTLIGTQQFSDIVSYRLNQDTLATLYSSIPFSNPLFIKRKPLQVYVWKRGPENRNWYTRIDPTNHSYQHILPFFDSFSFVSGDYAPATDMSVTILVRQEWKDSVANEIYVQTDIAIMNPDGTNLRIINIPE